MKLSRIAFLLTALGVGVLGLRWQLGRSGGCASCVPLPDLRTLFDDPPSMASPYPLPPDASIWEGWSPQQRLQSVNERVKPSLMEALQVRGLRFGAPVFLRAMKEERVLELWLRGDSGWQLWRSYSIAAASGDLGPKLREGDGQVPEGFYRVTSAQLNPASRYHLAMNLGYPNEYDRHHQRTGSFIMIHGRAVSVGCLAMTDPWIEEIYLLVAEALVQGQPEVPVHLFPFRLSEARLAGHQEHEWHEFWLAELWPAWQAFEAEGEPAEMRVQEGRYVLVPRF